jgi:hypothetical protein
LKNNLKLSAILVCKHQKRFYICNRLEQQSASIQASGRYSSGQRGQTVNLLCELRRFESCSPHGKAEKPENLKFSIFSKSLKKCLKASKSDDLLALLFYGLFSIFINAHKIKGAESVHFPAWS